MLGIFATALLLNPPLDRPVVESVYAVSPDIIGIEIRAQEVLPSSLERYRPLPGDEKETRSVRGKFQQIGLKRDGKTMGWLIGPKRNWLVRFEKLIGRPLDTDAADKSESYRVWVSDQEAVVPAAVYRKSKPHDWVQPSWEFPMVHRIYLRLPKPMEIGKNVQISFPGVEVSYGKPAFEFDPNDLSEAVHVSQIGYRADDPIKQAFLSVWLGTGGAYRYPDGLRFRVVDDKTAEQVYEGRVVLSKEASESEKITPPRNHSQTSVYRMDFSDLQKPGRYRVVVDKVGSSVPFEIGANPWKGVFAVQMKGLYNHRSGVQLGPPHTTFRQPRDMHPADGQEVWQSTWSVLDKAEAFEELATHATREAVPQGWGGYHDAGDWNPRRVTHLRVAMAHLELLDLFPAFHGKLAWNLPAATFTRNGREVPVKGSLPDTLNEALWGLEIHRRLQKPNGSVTNGIESPGDPIDGEVSWLQSMPLYVYAPDVWSSYVYAGAAARFARLVQRYSPELSRIYQASALKAMDWAEADWAKRDRSKLRSEATDDRNLAAVELLRLTKDRKWHAVFLENTVLNDPSKRLFAYRVNNQRDAAFAYTQLPASLSDPTIRRNAVAKIREDADGALEYAKGNGFGILQQDHDRLIILGYYSVPDAVQVCRAHLLTGERKYLAGAVQATQFAGGANPMNMTHTTGVGSNWPKHPLHLDSRRTGQAPPVGITVYGALDSKQHQNADWVVWPVKNHLVKVVTPSPWDWPSTEAYWDIFLDPPVNEYTVDMWTPNVYVWGYLAARK